MVEIMSFTHTFTHKKMGGGFDALLQMLRIIVTEVGSGLIFIDDRQHKGELIIFQYDLFNNFFWINT